MQHNLLIETCFTPALFNLYKNTENVVIVVDILRATTSICTAFQNGIKELIPVSGIDDAMRYKDLGYLVAAERDGRILDFADIGNSPEDFSEEIVFNKTIAYSTTNGTQAINMASDCHAVVIGAFINITALSNWLLIQNRNITILCAGWKNKFNLEDSLFAGALSEKLLKHEKFFTDCDSTLAAIELWKSAKDNTVENIKKASHYKRLCKLGKQSTIEYCMSQDLTQKIPVLKNGKIISQ